MKACLSTEGEIDHSQPIIVFSEGTHVDTVQLTLAISTSLISKWKSGPCLNMKI